MKERKKASKKGRERTWVTKETDREWDRRRKRQKFEVKAGGERKDQISREGRRLGRQRGGHRAAQKVETVTGAAFLGFCYHGHADFSAIQQTLAEHLLCGRP